MPLLTSRAVTGMLPFGARAIALRSDVAQVGGDLVGQHLLQSEPEQMRRIAAVGPRRDVAADAGGAARSAVAGGAAVGQPGADGEIDVEVAAAVAGQRPLSLFHA